MKLVEAGFTNIDGLDPSEGMLEICRRKQIYTNLICDYVGEKKCNIQPGKNIGIKYGFPCIKICQVPREVLQNEVEHC